MGGTKLILSIIGVSAIIIPAILLMVLTGRAPEQQEPTGGRRILDTKTVEEAVKRVPSPSPVLPSPSPSSPSAEPVAAPSALP